MPQPRHPGHPSPARRPGHVPPGYVGPAGRRGDDSPDYGPPLGYGPPQQGAIPPGYGPPGQGSVPRGHGPPPGYAVAAPPPTSPSGQPLASFVDRLLAVLIDGAILTGAVMVIAVPAFIVFFATAGSDFFTVPDPDGYTAEPDPLGFLVPLLLIEAGLLVVAMILQYVYHVEMSKRTGQTVGKRVMKIKIIPLDPASSIGRGFLARRFLVQWAGGLVPGLSYLDGLWQLWDKPYQQCLHDKFAKTVVVKVPA